MFMYMCYYAFLRVFNFEVLIMMMKIKNTEKKGGQENARYKKRI